MRTSLTYSYDTGIVGAALPMVGTDLGHKLSHTEEEIITAATTIGAFVGSLIIGFLADRLGRKWCMVIADIKYVFGSAFVTDTRSFTIGAILIAASYSVAQIIVGRLVLGFGVGGAAVIGPLYIAELAPTAVRGRCMGVNAFFIPFGQVVASALGAAFEAAVPKHIGWRVLCKSILVYYGHPDPQLASELSHPWSSSVSCTSSQSRPGF